MVLGTASRIFELAESSDSSLVAEKMQLDNGDLVGFFFMTSSPIHHWMDRTSAGGRLHSRDDDLAWDD